MHTAVVEMNGRVRRPAVAHGAKAAARPRNDKVMEKDRKRTSSRMPAMKASSNNTAALAGITSRSQARRDRKLALQQDVDKLRKKLRHEENVHRALERAFTRPLGALPRLPPYLPSQTLELLAEVAVLEEEVVRLEEQVVGFRQDLYHEAIIASLAKSACLSDGGERCMAPAQLRPSTQMQNSEVSASAHHGSDEVATWSSLKRVTNVKQTPRKHGPSLSHGDRPGKENQSCTSNSCRDCSRSPLNNVTKCSVPVLEQCPGARIDVEDTNAIDSDKASTEANKVAEELLTCLLTIFSQMSMSSSGSQDDDRASSPSVSGSSESFDGAGDPYRVLELRIRDIGPYKQFIQVDATSFHQKGSANDALLGQRLKALLRKLSAVDLVGLSHQQRLAFWINTYNSCMMNAFLEQGAPTTPHMLVAMMPKATINVGGRVLSAMTIEHFILRLPYTAKHVNGPKGMKNAGEDVAAGGAFALEWPEPRVTFALSCGSWSSPAVRVYTAAHVEEELEAAKRDYLQAAVGISAPSRLAIPKLLHWYLLDFAKDVSSLMDWVCLQLPSELRHDAVRVVEAGRRSPAFKVPVQVVPYEFRFRYLLA